MWARVNIYEINLDNEKLHVLKEIENDISLLKSAADGPVPWRTSATVESNAAEINEKSVAMYLVRKHRA